MEQRDLLKDQIEQLGMVLGKIFANFFGLKAEGKIALGMEITQQNLKSELDLDIDKMIGLTKENLNDYLINKRLTPKHVDDLSDYLIECGSYYLQSDKNQAKTTLLTAMELLKISNDHSIMYSFDRKQKEEKIKDLMKINDL